VAFGLVRISLPDQSSSEQDAACHGRHALRNVRLSFRFICQTAQRAHDRIPATRLALGFLQEERPSMEEGTGNAGCLPHPQPRVGMKENHTSFSHHRYAETLRHSLRDGFTVSSVLSSETRRCCLRRLRMDFASLTPALGRRDHTASPSVAQIARQASPQRPSHPASRIVTFAKRPSF
jgi:hypothetical protein